MNDRDLQGSRCSACRGDEPKMSREELASYRSQLPDWQVVERDGIERLERTFRFADFVQAIRFTNAVADIAEREGHHPALLTEWGKVTVSWWTHKIGGLHRNDCIMAAKTDALSA